MLVQNTRAQGVKKSFCFVTLPSVAVRALKHFHVIDGTLLARVRMHFY